MELYGISAAITYAKELMADLDDQRAMKKKEEDSLSTKFKKIQDFEARAVCLFSLGLVTLAFISYDWFRKYFNFKIFFTSRIFISHNAPSGLWIGPPSNIQQHIF